MGTGGNHVLVQTICPWGMNITIWIRKWSQQKNSRFSPPAMTAIGGRIKVSPEDFRVEERPLYLPCGDGEHLYVRITKRGLSTPDLVLRLSSVLGVKVKGIGVAGLKDAQAVTTQMVSLHGIPEDKLSRIRSTNSCCRWTSSGDTGTGCGKAIMPATRFI